LYSNGGDDGLDKSLVRETPDEDEADEADHDNESDDEFAETEGELHEVDDESKIKLGEEDALALEAIMQKPNRRHARFLKCIKDLNAPHEDKEVVWSPSKGSDESGGDSPLQEDETEEEWDGSPDE
jgi:hypothetical protein